MHRRLFGSAHFDPLIQLVEALWRHSSNERDAQNEAAKSFSERDFIEGAVKEYIKGKDTVDPTDVACYAMQRGGAPKTKPGDLRREDRRRVISVLRQVGCVEVRVDVDGAKKRLWRVGVLQ